VVSTIYDVNFPKPAFKIGDLVVAAYDFMDYFYANSFYPDDYVPPPRHVGVVISVDAQPHYFGEFIYSILCVDGSTRYFLEEEMVIL